MKSYKLARICYNSNKWTRPSGPQGKSDNIELFEAKYGYGLEEWLSNEIFEINEYRYGFIESVERLQDDSLGKTHDIILFTHSNRETKVVGMIFSAELMTKEERRNITVRLNDTLGNEIEHQLSTIQKELYISEYETRFKVNIRFKPSNLIWHPHPIKIKLKNKELRYVKLYDAGDEIIKKLPKYTPPQNMDLYNDLSEVLDDASDLSNSEKRNMILSRIGQGTFRKNVIEFWGGEERCALIGTDIRDLLVASHIKAWSDCESTAERLDGANGLLLCAHIDKLFDRHLITFKKEGGEFFLKLSRILNDKKIALNGLQIENNGYLSTTRLTLTQTEKFERYMKVHNAIFDKKENDIE
ncbi:HNH endonuclease [Aeromonas jandaei]|uniref:HNH endonuclease n=1 Tax=Aeromonas jandaei TaxID=650 RepID=UPI00191D7042|nr:HNH endonuclease signature motif containing protein [Aeromonas jandaei]MBL0612271.1 HNH endonuclease [Aeromonas jandaei]